MAGPAFEYIDKYRIIRLLGEGGMGSVYEVEHSMIGKRCALKVLRPEYARNETVLRRMMREARAAAAIGHPNIVETLDFGMLPDGTCYLAMELLKGQGLDRYLEQTGRVPAQTAAAIILQVLSAIVAAHAKGIVHRDLKPENIFIAQSPLGGSQVKLLDFGISKFAATDSDSMQLTQTGTVMGTPYYMSPEQAGGDRSIDGRSDLWSVGVILYRMLTGTLPFTGDNYNQVILKIVMQPYAMPRELEPSIPAELELVIHMALQKEASRRFQRATEFIEALLPFHEGSDSGTGRFVVREELLRSNPNAVVLSGSGWTPGEQASSPGFSPGRSHPVGPQAAPGYPGGPSPTDGAGPTSAAVSPRSLPGGRPAPAMLEASGGSAPALDPGEMVGRRSVILGRLRKGRWLFLSFVGTAALLVLVLGGYFVASAIDHRGRRSSSGSPGASEKESSSGAVLDAGPAMTQALPPMDAVAGESILRVTLVGMPDRATIRLDGKAATHPLILPVDQRNHRLDIEAPGFHPFRTHFVAQSGLKNLDVEMTPRAGHTPRPPTEGVRPATGPRPAGMAWEDPFANPSERPAAERPRAPPRRAPPGETPRKTMEGVYSNPFN